MATTVIENLITRFGFDVDQNQLNKIDAGIKNVAKGLTAIAVSAVAAGTAMFVFAKKTAETNDELGKFAETIGVDIGSMQELGFAAELNGGSIDSMNGALSNLSKTMSEVARGVGGGAETFGRLGLSATDANGKIKKTDEFLFEIADSLAGLGTQAEKLDFASKLGIDKNLILTLDKGSDALRRARKEAQELGFIIDKNAAKSAADFNDALLKTGKIVSGISNAIGQELMKEITPMLNIFVKWFKVNKDIIKQNVIGFVKNLVIGFRTLFNMVSSVAKTFIWLTKVLGGLENVIIILGTAFLVLGIKAALIPLVLIAVGAGLFLLLDEIRVFSTGGKSVMGLFFDSVKEDFEEFKITIEKTKNLLKGKGFRLDIKSGSFGIQTPEQERASRKEQDNLLNVALTNPNVRRNEQGIPITAGIGGSQAVIKVEHKNDIKIEIKDANPGDLNKVKQVVIDTITNNNVDAMKRLKSNIK